MPPQVAVTFDQKCGAFIESLFPRPKPAEEFIQVPVQNWLPPNSTLNEIWPELTLQEIIKASNANKTAPGKDKIEWTMVSQAVSTIPEFFTIAYRSLFNGGVHPEAWKIAVGIIIPKRNKKDYSSPKSYRPISLLPCLSKLLEKLFANRLAYLANNFPHFLHSSQMGGRKQRSAIDATLLLQNFIERKWTKGQIVSTVLLDIQGAFDQLQPSKLIRTLHALQLPNSFIRWCDSFLSNRRINLIFDNQISRSYPVSGTPQGSPISPLLFLLSIRDLLPQESGNFLTLSYIDDIAISIASKTSELNCIQLQEFLTGLFQRA